MVVVSMPGRHKPLLHQVSSMRTPAEQVELQKLKITALNLSTNAAAATLVLNNNNIKQTL